MEPRKLTSEQRELYNYALYSCLSFQNAPYLAPILVRLKPLSLPGLRTLASDSKGHVFIDFDFLEANKVGIEDFGRVVQHEAWHVINMHSIISAEVHGQYYASTVNIAMDLEINQHIPHIEEGWTGMTACLPGSGSFSQLPKHLTWREYLDYIPDLPEMGTRGDIGDSVDGSSDDEDESGSSKEQKTGSDDESDGNQRTSCGRSQLNQEILDRAQELDPGIDDQSMEKTAAIREVASRVKEHAKNNPVWGAAHEDLVGWANRHLAPSVVPWKRRLSRVLGTKISNTRPRYNYTWRKPSRRHSYGVGKPYYPAFRGEKNFEPNIVIGIDVSGSMSIGKTLNHVAGEIDAILRSHTVRSAYAFFVDVETEALQEDEKGAEIVRSGDTSLVKFSKVKSIFRYLYSGGGTDMSRALIAASELKGKFRPDIFILVTDCETPWLKEEPKGLKRVETIILAVNTDFSATTSSEEVCEEYGIPEWLSKGVIPVPAEK